MLKILMGKICDYIYVIFKIHQHPRYHRKLLGKTSKEAIKIEDNQGKELVSVLMFYFIENI